MAGHQFPGNRNEEGGCPCALLTLSLVSDISTLVYRPGRSAGRCVEHILSRVLRPISVVNSGLKVRNPQAEVCHLRFSDLFICLHL